MGEIIFIEQKEEKEEKKNAMLKTERRILPYEYNTNITDYRRYIPIKSK